MKTFIFASIFLSFCIPIKMVSAATESPEILGVKIGMTEKEVISVLEKAGGKLLKGVMKREPHFWYSIVQSPSAEARIVAKTKIGDRHHNFTEFIKVYKLPTMQDTPTRVSIRLVEDTDLKTAIVYEIKYEKTVKREFKAEVANQVVEFLRTKYGPAESEKSPMMWKVGDEILIYWYKNTPSYQVINTELRDRLVTKSRNYTENEIKSRLKAAAPKVKLE